MLVVMQMQQPAQSPGVDSRPSSTGLHPRTAAALAYLAGPFSGALMPVQVQTTEGFSSDNFTISACPIVCAGAAPAASRR